MKHARGKRFLAAFLSVAMTVSMLSTQVFAAEMPENATSAVTLSDEDKPTQNKPTKKVTDANVADMQITLYAVGSEVLNPTGSPYAVSGNAGTVGTGNVAYEISDIYGNDVDGYFTDVTFHFAHGDKMESNGSDAFNRHPVLSDYPEWQGDWMYDFSKCDADQTVTLKYMTGPKKWVVNGKTNGTSAVANVIKVYLKLPSDCLVTYTDGVDDEVLFEDQTYTVKEGSETPAFVGTPERENWVFTGWSPEVSDTVTGDVTYVAQWEKGTSHKPRKGVTATDVSKMEIRFYGTGTEVLNPNNEPYSVGGTSGKVGTDNVAYEIGDIYGNDVDGYSIDITFHFAHGDKMEANGSAAFNRHPVLKNYPEWQGNWVYDFSKCDADQTLTLSYNPNSRKWVVPGSNNMTSAVANVIQVYMNLSYTVTYTDGVDGEDVFADQTYTALKGEETPAFVGTPERENWVFTGWSPEVSDTVTGDVTYVAQWEKGTSKKPRKGVTATDVSKMEIRFYGTGTEVLNPNNEPYSVGGTSGKVGTDNVAYEIGDIYGNDVDGYSIDITFHFAHGDKMEANGSAAFNRHPVLKNYPEWQGNWVYDFSKCDADQTLTLSYNPNSRKWVVPGSNNMTSAVANVIQVYMNLSYTVTYTDGVDGEEVFADQTYTALKGNETPDFVGTPERENWVFTGWSPAVSDTVTGDVTYVAQWEKGTSHKPSKGVTATDVSKMQIRFYGTGTEVLNPNNEPYSLGGTAGKVGTDNVAYEIGDIYGNDVDGYFIDIDFHFAHGDKMEANGRDAFNRHSTLSKYPEWQGNWVYDFENCEADQTLTLVYDTGYRKWIVPGSNNMTSAVANVIKVYMAITPYTVTYTDGVTDEEIFADETYTVGEGSLTPAFTGTPEREGYTFAGWDQEIADVVTQDVTYTAVWTANTYTLTLDAGEGMVDPATVTVTYDAAIGELPVPTRDGYEFAGWTDENGVIVTADTVYMTAGDSTLTAQWEEIPEEPGTVDPEDPDDTQNPDDPQKPGDGTQDSGDNTQGSGDDTQKPGDTENVDDNDVPQSGADNNTTNNAPQTGDESSLALLLTMLLASAAGFGVMGLRRREEK